MRKRILAGALAALALGGAAMTQSAKAAGPVAVGSEAADFRLNDHEGKVVRLSEFRGKAWVVLAFYPKALTGG